MSSKGAYKSPKKEQQHLPINNTAELMQFKYLLKNKRKSEVDILTLPVNQTEGIRHAINHSVAMVVRRND